MSINFKPINEVPVIEELAEGDMLLVNSNGAAKQIDASKVGGKGGGGTIVYIKDFPDEVSDSVPGVPCKDAELTQVMSTAELLAAFAAGPVVLSLEMGGMPVWATPQMTMHDSTSGVVMSLVLFGDAAVQLIYLCSDTSIG